MEAKRIIILVGIMFQSQCDHIEQFIGLWETFKSLWQQFTCQNVPYSQAIFVKVLKSIFFQ